MALSKLERRMLEMAREKLRDEKATRVCSALIFACSELVEVHRERYAYQARERLRQFVMGSLGGWVTLEQWIDARNPAFRELIGKPNAMREVRIEWITWMLGEEEKPSEFQLPMGATA